MEGPANLTRYGKALQTMSTSGSKVGSLLSKIGFGLTRLNVGLAVGTTAIMLSVKAWKAHNESMRLNALGYGMTAEGAAKQD